MVPYWKLSPKLIFNAKKFCAYLDQFGLAGVVPKSSAEHRTIACVFDMVAHTWNRSDLNLITGFALYVS